MTREYPSRDAMIAEIVAGDYEDRACLATWSTRAIRRVWWDWIGGPALAARLYPTLWADWAAHAARGECSATWHDFRWYYRLPAARPASA